MTDSYGSNAPMRRRGRDRGQTLVEVLVSIVLLGTAVGGTLTALRATIISSQIDEGLAKANSWLREAEVALHHADYEQCTTTLADIQSAYRTVIQLVPPPQGWEVGATIDIASVQVWGRDVNRHEGWMPSCVLDPDTPFPAQRVQFYVLSPAGEVGRTIQVVKGG